MEIRLPFKWMYSKWLKKWWGYNKSKFLFEWTGAAGLACKRWPSGIYAASLQCCCPTWTSHPASLNLSSRTKHRCNLSLLISWFMCRQICYIGSKKKEKRKKWTVYITRSQKQKLPIVNICSHLCRNVLMFDYWWGVMRCQVLQRLCALPRSSSLSLAYRDTNIRSSASAAVQGNGQNIQTHQLPTHSLAHEKKLQKRFTGTWVFSDQHFWL